MLNDSLISLMIMLLLCFMGMLVMFLFVIRSQSTQAAVLREGFTRQQSTLADLEQQLMDMNFALRRLQKGSGLEDVPERPGAASSASSGSGASGASTGGGQTPKAYTAVGGIHAAAGGAYAGGALAASGGAYVLPGDDSGDLRALFTPDAQAEKEYSYPSAAGLGPLDDPLYGISLPPVRNGREKTDEAKQPAGLDIKLDR